MGLTQSNSTGVESAGPVSDVERIDAVDALRGVAVLGILVMNIYAFAMPFDAYDNPLLMGGTEWYNLGTWFFTHIFFDQKFMTIFSMLFGGGLVIMWQRAEASGADFGAIFFRRQIWLLVIAAVHAYLIWFGDILFHYAVVGMLVFSFRRCQPRRLIALGLLLLPVAPLLLFGVAEYFTQLRVQATEIRLQLDAGETITAKQQAIIDEWEDVDGALAPTPEVLQEAVDAYRGDYSEIVRHRAPEVLDIQLSGTLVIGIWRLGGLMLIGMALMKLGILSGAREERFYRNMLLAGYGLGLPVMIASCAILAVAGWDSIFMLRVGALPNYIGSILVATGHIAAVMLILKAGALAGLMARFSAVGRMALTNYLMHSVVMTSIFYGYGLGLFGVIPRSAQMLFVAGMLGFQLWLSPIWLKNFRFGPVEWLWRSLTYQERQPMRRSA